MMDVFPADAAAVALAGALAGDAMADPLEVDEYRLFASGIGYIDAHLIASARVGVDVTLWTRDRRLQSVAEWLGLAAHPLH